MSRKPIPRTITDEQALGTLTKQCMRCGEVLPLTTFGVNGSLPSGKQKYKPRCNPCVGIHEREVFNQKLYEVVGGRENLKCSICGYNRSVAGLDFHHLDPNTKDREIAVMKNYSKDALKREIDKCIILCACCHRELHVNEHK